MPKHSRSRSSTPGRRFTVSDNRRRWRSLTSQAAPGLSATGHPRTSRVKTAVRDSTRDVVPDLRIGSFAELAASARNGARERANQRASLDLGTARPLRQSVQARGVDIALASSSAGVAGRTPPRPAGRRRSSCAFSGALEPSHVSAGLEHRTWRAEGAGSHAVLACPDRGAVRRVQRSALRSRRHDPPLRRVRCARRRAAAIGEDTVDDACRGIAPARRRSTVSERLGR